MVEKVFTGPIQRQLSDALLYIKNYIIKEKVIKSSDKAEAERFFNYPYAAVEEILSNAVYHRSYQINGPITVRVSPKSIEITSFPGFDRSISDDSIRKYELRAKIYRNRRIGDFLKELKLIEGRNTGFPNAFKALKDNGSDYPKFEMDENRSYLSVTIPVHSSFLNEKNVSDKHISYVNKITDAVGNDSLTLSEIAKRMGYKGITKKLSTTVANVSDEGPLEKIIVGTTVKYRVK
jgi:ATP-dependent DNA helicase RecG